MTENRVLIVGGGIGGLTLALCLHAHGIACRVFEQASAFRPLGVGINILPHASAELARLGLADALARVSVLTREAVFYNRFGQLIYAEPLGRYAGYTHPQYSIHRARLHDVLHRAVVDRLGRDAVVTGAACTHVTQDGQSVHGAFRSQALAPARGDALVACDGLHSVVRRQLHPNEGPPRYSGVNMWRGVTRVAAHSHRRQHDPRRMARGRQDGDLSDRGRRRRRRPAARQLGGGDRDAAAHRRATGTAAASSATSSARSPIGNSTGSTCRQ